MHGTSSKELRGASGSVRSFSANRMQTEPLKHGGEGIVNMLVDIMPANPATQNVARTIIVDNTPVEGQPLYVPKLQNGQFGLKSQ